MKEKLLLILIVLGNLVFAGNEIIGGISCLDDINCMYDDLKFDEKPNREVFALAVSGYLSLQNNNSLPSDNQYVTIVDFTLSSTEKRLWVIDISSLELVLHSLCAHGRNSGNEYAVSFSNKPNSYQSSLGFYMTGKTYYGKHGLSLRLHGLEDGVNHNALSRAIVLHGAEYVSEDFIDQYGRCGRSYGCPAVPQEVSKTLIETIKNGTCLFLYHPDHYTYSPSRLKKKV